MADPGSGSRANNRPLAVAAEGLRGSGRFFGFISRAARCGTARLEEGTRVQKYLDCLKEVFDGDPPSPVDYVVFSDSIILTTQDESLPALQALLARCSTLLGVMLANEIAMRGAIAHGPYITETTGRGRFVAGKAIVEAFHFECAQDWIGIMLAPSVIQTVQDLRARCRYEKPHTQQSWRALRERLPWAAFVQPCSHIPFHASGGDAVGYDGFAIVPSSGDTSPAALRDSLMATLDRLAWLKALAPNPRDQAKYVRSVIWLSQIRGQWHDVVYTLDQNPAWLSS